MNTVRREVFEQEILRCLLAKLTLAETAKVVKLDVSTVRKYVRAEHFRGMLKEKYPEIYANVDAMLQSQADSVAVLLEENSRKALDKIAQLMDSDNQHIALKASQDALDRYQETSKMTKVEAEHHLKIDPTVLIHAAATAKEMDQFKAAREGKALPPVAEGEVIQ